LLAACGESCRKTDKADKIIEDKIMGSDPGWPIPPLHDFVINDFVLLGCGFAALRASRLCSLIALPYWVAAPLRCAAAL
jgi:hypothetical protein